MTHQLKKAIIELIEADRRDVKACIKKNGRYIDEEELYIKTDKAWKNK